MILFVNIIYLFVGLLIYKFIVKSYSHILNHVSIFTFVWLFIIILTQLIGYTKPYLTEETLSVVYISWYFFLFGSYINEKKISSEITYSENKYDFNKLKLLFYILFLLSIIANISILTEVYGNYTDLERWANLRKTDDLLVFKENNIFYALFGSAWSIYIPLSVFLLKHNMIKKYIFYFVTIVSIIISISGFTRAPLLKLLIVLLLSYVYIFNIRKFPVKYVVGVILVVFFVFIFSTWALSGGGKLTSTFDSVQLYLFGGISAYQDLLNGKYIDRSYYNYDSKYYSLDFINYILKRLNIINSYPNYVREFEDVYGGNVYTYLDSFTLDFNIFGAFIGSYIFGFICKKFYLYFVNYTSLANIIIYITFCYYCAFVFMNNEFLRFGALLFIVEVYLIFYFVKLEIKK